MAVAVQSVTKCKVSPQEIFKQKAYLSFQDEFPKSIKHHHRKREHHITVTMTLIFQVFWCNLNIFFPYLTKSEDNAFYFKWGLYLCIMWWFLMTGDICTYHKHGMQCCSLKIYLHFLKWRIYWCDTTISLSPALQYRLVHSDQSHATICK